MPIKKIKLPNGDAVELDIPDGATPEQIRTFAVKFAANYPITDDDYYIRPDHGRHTIR